MKHLHVLVEGTRSRLHDSINTFVIDNLDEYLEFSHRLAAGNRNILIEYLQPLINEGILIGDIPEYGCIYFPKIRNVDDTRSLADDLLDKYKVYIVPGHFFREPGHIRIGFGARSESLKRSLEVFLKAITDLIK
jgi:aspartate/methionine/tyrosine aminotransferase